MDWEKWWVKVVKSSLLYILCLKVPWSHIFYYILLHEKNNLFEDLGISMHLTFLKKNPASSGHPASARFPKAGWPSNHGNLVSKPEVVLFNWRKKSNKPLLIRLTKVNIKDFSGRQKSGSNETEVMEYSWLLCTHLCPLAIQRHSNPSCSRPEREKCGRLADGMSMLASVIDLAKWILYNLFVFIAPGLLKLERIING